MLERCNQFGFDRKKINQRLGFLRLSRSDHKLAQRLNLEVIKPNLNTIIDNFYQTLLFHPESRRWLLDGNTIDELKQKQRSYLLGLGIGFDSTEYFEDRLQVGIIHAAIGLPLSTYQCAYTNLIQYIINVIPDSIRQDSTHYQAMTNFILKITSLDMSLAVETYHDSFMNEMEDEVKTAHSRERKLQKQAETDTLTGLYNRKYAFCHLNEAISNALQYSTDLCLLMLDIDYFKKVNDNYGHQAGDTVLHQVAQTISKTLRDQDIIGRYGGEEFIIGLIGIGTDIANQVAERIRKCIEQSPVTINNETIQITVSIGMSTLEKEDNLQSLIKRSDMALYSAKGAGRNRVLLS